MPRKSPLPSLRKRPSRTSPRLTRIELITPRVNGEPAVIEERTNQVRLGVDPIADSPVDLSPSQVQLYQFREILSLACFVRGLSGGAAHPTVSVKTNSELSDGTDTEDSLNRPDAGGIAHPRSDTLDERAA
jgi:hypothetical protein